MESRAVLRLALSAIIKTSRGDIRVAEPLLHFGDIRFVRQRVRRCCRAHRVYAKTIYFRMYAGFAAIFYDDVAVDGTGIERFFQRACAIVPDRTEKRAIYVQFVQATAVFQRFEIFGNESLRRRVHRDEADLVALSLDAEITPWRLCMSRTRRLHSSSRRMP